jgi:hypothetical protein
MCIIDWHLCSYWKRKISMWIFRSKSKYFNDRFKYSLYRINHLSWLSNHLWFSGLFFMIWISWKTNFHLESFSMSINKTFPLRTSKYSINSRSSLSKILSIPYVRYEQSIITFWITSNISYRLFSLSSKCNLTKHEIKVYFFLNCLFVFFCMLNYWSSRESRQCTR